LKLGIMLPNVLAPCSDDGKTAVSPKDLEAMSKLELRYLQARPEAFCNDDMEPTKAGEDALKRLAEFDLTIVGWCGYKPLIGKPEVVEAGVEHILRVIRFARQAAETSDRVRPTACSESGNPAQNPEIPYERKWSQIVDATRRIADAAERNGAVFAFEPTRANILDGSANTCKLIREVGSDRVKVLFDPANIVGDKDTLEGAVENLKPHIILAHAKDVILKGEKPEYPPAGKGELDYPRIFELLAPVETCNEIIIEYVRTPEQAHETIEFLRPFCE